VAAHRLVYLLAASHSGSTLTATLLGAHPDLVTAGELKLTALGDLERYLCSCGERLRACPFWTGVQADMGARGFPFDLADAGTDLRSGATAYELRLLAPLHRGAPWEALRDAALALSPSWRRRLPALQRRNAALVGALLARTGAHMLVDSSKVGLRLKYLLRNPELDVRVVRVVRDGRAVALTYMDPARFADASDPKRRDGGTGGDRERERLPMTEAAREWRRSNEEAEAVLAGLPRERWTALRYEELCADPAATLGRVFAFLGLPPAAITRATPGRLHVVGNGMRLDGDVPVRLDERWRERLTADELATFDAAAGDLNRRYGYV
jgi:hypothetical protein